MSFSVTAFGAVFLPLALSIFLFRRVWLLPLLCVSAVLQAPAVALLELGGERQGVTPFLATGAFVALEFLLRAWRVPRPPPLSPEARILVRLWLALGTVAIASAFLLPWLFQGLEVFTPLDKEGTHAATVPLVWSLSNGVQAFNRAVLLLVLLWLLQQRADPALPRRLLTGMVLALGVAAAAGLQQRMAWNGLLPMWDGFWASNPTYAQNFRMWAGPVPRVSWPFVEPSYASAWYAGALGGCLALFLAARQRQRALLGCIVAAAALANSLGATGFIAIAAYAALALAVSLAWSARSPSARGTLLYQYTLGALVAACLGLLVYLVLRHYALDGVAAQAIAKLLEGRNQTLWGDLRPHADLHGLQLLRDTWGLGVGVGSNRGSSFLVTLAASQGLLGLGLFVFAFVLQLRALELRLRRRPASPALYFLGAAIAMLLAVALAIPDQNWPPFWLVLFAGVACLAAPEDAGTDAPAARPRRRRRHARPEPLQ